MFLLQLIIVQLFQNFIQITNMWQNLFLVKIENKSKNKILINISIFSSFRFEWYQVPVLKKCPLYFFTFSVYLNICKNSLRITQEKSLSFQANFTNSLKSAEFLMQKFAINYLYFFTFTMKFTNISKFEYSKQIRIY